MFRYLLFLICMEIKKNKEAGGQKTPSFYTSQRWLIRSCWGSSLSYFPWVFHMHTLILSAKQLISERLWWFDNRRLLCREMKGEETYRETERVGVGGGDQKYGFWCRTHPRYIETDLKSTAMCVSYFAGSSAVLISKDQWTTQNFIAYSIYVCGW